MKEKRMLALMDSLDPSKMPHIFCPSYMRPNFVSGRIFRTFEPEVLEKVHIVVRPEQYKAYKKANPEFDIISLGDYPVNGLASTRQFIYEYAVEHKYSTIIDMDDDITNLSYLFSALNGSGNPCSKHSFVRYDYAKDFYQKILLLGSYIARGVFKQHPDVVLGNLRRQRLSMDPDNAKLKYIVDCGPTPRQVTFMNIKGLKRLGIDRDVERFDRHGDDIGFCAVILSNGGHCFNIPCLAYDYISEKCDSVVRTPETEKELHAYEYAKLQEYPIKNYLRTTFKDEEGNYMWGDIDWRKFHKLNKSTPIKRLWKEDNYSV